jgi:hypothetical protein
MAPRRAGGALRPRCAYSPRLMRDREERATVLLAFIDGPAHFAKLSRPRIASP